MITAISFKIIFDKTIDKERDYISPGGYEIKTADDKSVIFDFMDYEGTVNGKVLDCLCHTLDTDSFPEAAKLTREDVANIKAIPEFFVYLGEFYEQFIVPEKIKDLAFSFDDGYPDLHINGGLPINICCSC